MKHYNYFLWLVCFLFLLQHSAEAQYNYETEGTARALSLQVAAGAKDSHYDYSEEYGSFATGEKLERANTYHGDEYLLEKNSPGYVRWRLRQLERQLYEKTRREVITEKLAYREVDPTISQTYYNEGDELKNQTAESLNEADIEREVQRRMDKEVILKLFGREFFETGRLDKTTLFESMAPSDYKMGSGDELKIIIWSDIGDQTVYDLQINPQGQIYVPTLGIIVVSGKTISEVQDLVLGQLREKFPHFKGQVSLTKLRSIQIYLAGEVEQPGALIVSGLSTAFSALYQAGGPNRRGSMRNITVTNPKGESRRVDLYKYLLTGDRSQDVPISNGDTIFVPMAGDRVTVSGMLARPAIYEIRDNTTLADIIKMAGGVLPEAYEGRISITRWGGTSMRKTFDVSLEDKAALKKFIVKSGDEIKIGKALEKVGNNVSLNGPVLRPGKYAIDNTAKTVKDFVEKAGGFVEEEINMDRGQIYRKIDGGQQEIISFVPRFAMAGDKTNNVELKPFDVVKFFAESEVKSEVMNITVDGAIRRPGKYIFRSGMKLADLLVKAQGLSLDADGSVEIARYNDNNEVEIIRVNGNKALEDAQSEDNVALKPLDRISLPSSMEKHTEVDIVVLKGQVLRPGPYALKYKGEKLSSVIKRAGGITPMAFPEGCIFMRKAEYISNKNQFNTAQNMQNELYRQATLDLRTSILRNGGSLSGNIDSKLTDKKGESVKEQVIDSRTNIKPGEDSQTITKEQSSVYSDIEMRSREFNRENVRIPIPLKDILEGKAEEFEDISLLDGDQITIPVAPHTVSVVGAVMNPATILFSNKHTNAGYYINKCGGFNNASDHRRSMVIRANGEVIRMRQCKKIERGDIILIPPKARIVKPSALKEMASVAQVLGNLAVTYKVVRDD